MFSIREDDENEEVKWTEYIEPEPSPNNAY